MVMVCDAAQLKNPNVCVSVPPVKVTSPPLGITSRIASFKLGPARRFKSLVVAAAP